MCVHLQSLNMQDFQLPNTQPTGVLKHAQIYGGGVRNIQNFIRAKSANRVII